MGAAFDAGSIVGHLVLDKAKWNAAVKGVKTQTKSMGQWVQKNSAQFKKMGMAIMAAGAVAAATFTKMVKDYVEVGDWIDKMAKRTGFSAVALSELSYAADISGANLNDVEKSVKRMSRSIVEAGFGLESYVRGFTMIGLEVKNLEKLDPETQFLQIAEGIAGITRESEKAAVAQMIFGRAGTSLLPLFKEGKEGLKALREEAHRLGIVFDTQAAKRAADLKDRLTDLKKSFQGLGFAIVDRVVPVLTDLAKHFTDIFVNIQGNAGTFTTGILNFLALIAKGVHGLMMVWHGFQALVFKGAAMIGEVLEKELMRILAALVVMEKIPIFGKKLEGVTDAVANMLKTIAIVTDGYNESAEEQINKTTNVVQSLENLLTALNAVKNSYFTLDTESKKYGETLIETVIPAMAKSGAEILKNAGIFTEVAEFTGKTVATINEKHQELMKGFAQTYQQGIFGIMQTLKRWAIGEIIKSLAASKMPFLMKLAILAPTVALFEGVFGKLGKPGAAEGGLFHRRRVVELAEREPERVVREREWQEMKRGERAQQVVTFAPVITLQTLDPYTAAEVTRNQIMPQMLEALQSKLLLEGFKTALEIK